MNTIEADEGRLLRRLQANPDDVEALTGMSMLAARQGKLDAALLAAQRAYRLAPADVRVLRTVAHVHHDRAEWREARRYYELALERDGADQLTHEGACYVAMRLGDRERADFHRERAFRGRAVTVAPYTGSAKPVRVLLLVSGYGGNLDTRRYLDPERYAVTKIVAEYLDEVRAIPDADVIFNAIGDADRCARTLAMVRDRFAGTRIRMINPPERVLATSREENSRRFASIAGAVVPKVLSFPAAEIQSGRLQQRITGAELRYPVIARAPGFHTGQYCELCMTVSEIRRAVSGWPAGDILLTQFIDLRAAGGFTRKYRAMAIGGELHPLHMAASRDWKVHYMTSAMAEVPALRAEEAAFLAAPEAALGSTAWRALGEIAGLLALDYAGIDFGVDAAGRLVFFEANATMIVPQAPADPIWDYRRDAPRRVFSAVEQLVLGR